MQWRAALLSLLLAASSAACSANGDPQAVFTADLAARFTAAYPGVRVKIAGPLTLQVGDDSDPLTTNLDRIYNVCRANAADICEISKSEFVTNSAQTIAAQKDPAITAPRRENLRLLIRAASYCAESDRAVQSAATPSTLVYAPFTADTCILLMFDFPTSRRSASLEDLRTLGLTRDAAWEIAQAQVLSPLPKLASLDVEENAINAFADMSDITSLLLDKAGWAALAAKHPGKQVIVTMPDDGLLTLLIVGTKFGFDWVKTSARETFESAQRGISPLVYRWNETGWVAVP